jgi:hypothetical protein
MDLYDPTKVLINVASSSLGIQHVLVGFAEGSKISGEREEDKREAHVGVDGHVTFVKNANDLGTVTISLKHNSPSNQILNQLYQSDEEFKFACIDSNFQGGDVGIAGTRCVVANKPPFDRGDSVSENEWTLLIADYEDSFAGIL